MEKSIVDVKVSKVCIIETDFLFMFLKVQKSSSSTSVGALQSAVKDTVSQLEQQGLLSGEALGQIFTSISDMLNTAAGQDQNNARRKVTECD